MGCARARVPLTPPPPSARARAAWRWAQVVELAPGGHAQSTALLGKLDELAEAKRLDAAEEAAAVAAARAADAKLREDSSLPSDEEIAAEIDADEATGGKEAEGTPPKPGAA